MIGIFVGVIFNYTKTYRCHISDMQIIVEPHVLRPLDVSALLQLLIDRFVLIVERPSSVAVYSS